MTIGALRKAGQRKSGIEAAWASWFSSVRACRRAGRILWEEETNSYQTRDGSSSTCVVDINFAVERMNLAGVLHVAGVCRLQSLAEFHPSAAALRTRIRPSNYLHIKILAGVWQLWRIGPSSALRRPELDFQAWSNLHHTIAYLVWGTSHH